MQETQELATRREGLPAKLVILLASLVFAFGITPAFAQQAWADGESITVSLAAGNHQGSGKTSFQVTEPDKSAMLYAQVQDFKLGDSALVSSGWDAYYNGYGSGFSQRDCKNFTVTWYKESVSESNTLAVDCLQWNDSTSKPKWGTDFYHTPESIRSATDGEYKFYAVATVEKDGYTTARSEPLEFTVTVNRGGTTEPATEYGIATEASPSDGGTISVSNNVTGAPLTTAPENTSVAVDIKPNSGKQIASVQVLNGAGEDVSQTANLYDYTDNYYGSGSEYIFTMPAYAVKVLVTFADESTPATNDPTLTLVVDPVEATDLVELWDSDEYRKLTLSDGKISIASGKEIEIAFNTDGTDYELDTVTVTDATINTYGGYGYYFNMPTADATVNVKLKSTAAPTPVKVGAPSAITSLVYNGQEQTGVQEGDGYTLSGDVKATNAGDYTATATLNDGYVWSDDTSDDKAVAWSIAKKEIAVPQAVSGLTANGQEQAGVQEGEGYTLSGNKATEAGDYTAKATADDNHIFAGNKQSAEISWSIAAASEQPGGNEGEGGTPTGGSNKENTGGTTNGQTSGDSKKQDTAGAADTSKTSTVAGQPAVGDVVAAPEAGASSFVVSSDSTVSLQKADPTAKSLMVDTVMVGGKAYAVTAIAPNAFAGTKATTVTMGASVATISAKAFAKSKVKTVVLKSMKLTKKSVKNALKGSKVKTVKVKVGNKKTNKKYVKKYKKVFTKNIVGKKVTVK